MLTRFEPRAPAAMNQAHVSQLPQVRIAVRELYHLVCAALTQCQSVLALIAASRSGSYLQLHALAFQAQQQLSTLAILFQLEKQQAQCAAAVGSTPRALETAADAATQQRCGAEARLHAKVAQRYVQRARADGLQATRTECAQQRKRAKGDFDKRATEKCAPVPDGKYALVFFFFNANVTAFQVSVITGVPLRAFHTSGEREEDHRADCACSQRELAQVKERLKALKDALPGAFLRLRQVKSAASLRVPRPPRGVMSVGYEFPGENASRASQLPPEID